MSTVTAAPAGRGRPAAFAGSYAPAPEATDHLRLRERYGLFVDGALRRARGRPLRADDQPGHRGAAGRGRLRRPRRRRARVGAARAPCPRGRACPASSAASYVFRIARLIQERARELAVVESLDGGKPINESRDVDVPLAAAHFFYYAGWADKLRYGIAGRAPRPVGVCGQIVPWNFPLLMAAWKLAPALACGNTVVLKPAETTPLTALLLAEMCEEAELPPGVVNVIRGDGETGAALVRHAGVDKIAFTGSTAVGKDIQARARRPRRPPHARARRQVGEHRLRGRRRSTRRSRASSTASSSTRATSAARARACCCRRASPTRSSSALWRRMQLLRVGDPLDKNTDVGAINSAEQLERIEALVAAGEAEGATRRSVACALPERGYWFAPTLFLDVAPVNRIAAEEIFGPVVSVMTFRTQAEAIEKANNSPYGLAAGVWTDKGAKAFEVTSRCAPAPSGRTPTTSFDPTAAFGGYKESGFGREGGAAGLLPYLRLTHEPSAPPGRQDVQAVPRRRVRAQRVGPLRRGPRPRGRARGQRPARLAQGRARRGQGGARRVRRAGRGGPPTTAARSSTAWPRRSSRAPTSSPPQRRAARDRARSRRGARSRPPSTCRALRGLDGQAARRARAG